MPPVVVPNILPTPTPEPAAPPKPAPVVSQQVVQALLPLPPLPPLPDLPQIPGLVNMPVLSPEMQQQKEAREHKEYNDMMRAKQALMMIPGMNLAQADEWNGSAADLSSEEADLSLSQYSNFAY